jgi:uncharacterized protein with ParB-like and HNH nuclease domain
MPDAIEKIKSEIEDSTTEIINYKIIPYPVDFTLQGLFDKWEAEDISIPKYQRKYVWKLVQASRLIESFLMGLPVPGVFLYKDTDTNKLTVIDGQQRLKTIFGFMVGIFPGNDKAFKLEGINPKWEGQTFSELHSSDRLKIKDSVLRATIIEQLDPKGNSSVIAIFQRLNTGGTILTPQEVRNCIFHGPLIDLLNELNSDIYWRKIFGKPKPDDRMRDIELIGRFLALYHKNLNYYKPMKEFISDFINANRFGKGIPLNKINLLFSNTMKSIYNSLGPKPFNIRSGINAAVFDSVSIAFGKHLNNMPVNIKTRFHRLIENSEFLESVSQATTDVEVVKERIKISEKILFNK